MLFVFVVYTFHTMLSTKYKYIFVSLFFLFDTSSNTCFFGAKCISVLINTCFTL